MLNDTPVKSKEINIVLDEQCSVIAQLYESLETLEKSISYVCARPEPPEKESEKGRNAKSTPLGQRIDSHNEKLCNIVRLVTELASRVEV